MAKSQTNTNVFPDSESFARKLTEIHAQQDKSRQAKSDFKRILKTVFTTWTALFIVSFLDAALMEGFFNLSGVKVLGNLGYWNLYWINLAVVQPIGTMVGLSITNTFKLKDVYERLYSK